MKSEIYVHKIEIAFMRNHRRVVSEILTKKSLDRRLNYNLQFSRIFSGSRRALKKQETQKKYEIQM